MAGGNIVLIGFMGAGKTTVGRALASLLELELFDTDEMVERTAGTSIEEIWEAKGEEGFRDLEHEAVGRACAGGTRVIACGGGAILQMRNYELLKHTGVIVYLRAPADVLRARLSDDRSRPLLRNPAAFDRLLAERVPAYEAAADVIVDADQGAPEDIVEKIVGALL